MSEATPTDDQLPGLVDKALSVVDVRLSGGAQGTGLYDSVHAQLSWIKAALAAPGSPDRERLSALLLGVYAAREFETSDPEVADLLFDIQYLVDRHWPASEAGPVEPASAGPDQRALLIKRLGVGTAQYVLIGIVCLAATALFAFLPFVADLRLTALIVIVAFAAGGLAACAGLAKVLLQRGVSRRRLLDALDHHPERIDSIYLVASAPGYYQASRQVIQAPEADHMPAQPRMWSIVVKHHSAQTAKSQLDTIPVRRDQALPLLGWLRAKAPAAAGPPPPKGAAGG